MSEENNINKIHSVVITGTKGKTTVTNMISFVLHNASKDVITVDNLGSYFNLKKESSFDDSFKILGRPPHVMPGRYLYYYLNKFGKPLENLYAVLETSFGSAKLGTGIPEHEVGVFTNVFRDHIDGVNIKNEDDIYENKSFVFKNVKENGTYVANLDNPYSLKSLKEGVLLEKKANLYAVTTNISDGEELKKVKELYKLKDIFYFKNNKVFSLERNEIYNLTNFRYFMNGFNKPMIENTLYTFAVGLTYISVEEISKALDEYLLPEEYGRFLGFKRNNKIVIVDFAHEEISLKFLVDSISNLYNKDPYVITRVARDRADEFVKEYAEALAKLVNISGMTVYDKVDGVTKTIFKGKNITRHAGESSKIMFDSLQNAKPTFPVKRIVNDIDALKEALLEEDLIIFIFSEIERVLSFLNENGFQRFL